MASCPANSFNFNTTLCACTPGHVLQQVRNTCVLYEGNSTILTDSGVDYYALSFPETLFAFDTIKKFTQSQAVFLEATLVMLLSWLLFCVFLRCTKLGDGRNVWFKIRWLVSRLDICFATRHWLEHPGLSHYVSKPPQFMFFHLFTHRYYCYLPSNNVMVENLKFGWIHVLF